MGNLVEWSSDMEEILSGQLTSVFVDHDRSSHAERQALLAILGCLLSQKVGVFPAGDMWYFYIWIDGPKGEEIKAN